MGKREKGRETAAIGLHWPKGTMLRVKDELVGGSLLQELQPPDEDSHKIKIGSAAFEALKGLRKDGERLQDVMERLIFASAAGSPTSLQSYPVAGGT
jgi:hypothetical protein